MLLNEKHLTVRVPVVWDTATVKDTLAMLEKIANKYDSVDYIYVNDKDGNLVGMFYIQELFNRSKDSKTSEFMQKVSGRVSLGTDLEMVAHLALKHNLKQLPVVKSNKLIGVVSSREILTTINKSLRQDIFRFAGLHKSHLDFENSLEIPLFKAIKERLSWLIVGFIGAMLIAFYIGLFEETLQKYLIIAAFVPAIVYLSDALGTQIQTIFVRDLAVLGKAINFKKYFLKQIFISFFIASIIGILLFSSIYLFYGLFKISLIISLAAFVALIITSFTALIITLLIKKFNFDPALGSGPIATIISDMSSVIIYFLIVFLLI